MLLALCLVVAIADGDTLTARCGEPGAYQQVKVRVAGIDAPERGQPFGNVSRQHLAALCFQQQASITPRSIDRYGRTVADVHCQNLDAGAEQVRAGLAWVYERYASQHQHLYSLQDAAASARHGLWSAGEATAPWAWRRR